MDKVGNEMVVYNEYGMSKRYGEKLKLLGPRAINVGVDVNDFYPVSIYEIKRRVLSKEGDEE